MVSFEEIERTAAILADLCRQVREEREKETSDLEERDKQVRFLSQALSLASRHGVTVEQFCRELLDLIPPLWRFPDETAARIILDGKIYQTTNFIVETPWRAAADIRFRDQVIGTVEVFYTEEISSDDGRFLLWRQTDLIEAVAILITLALQKSRIQEKIEVLEAELASSQRAALTYETIITESASKMKRMNERSEAAIGAQRNLLANILRDVYHRLPVSAANGPANEYLEIESSRQGAAISFRDDIDPIRQFLGDVLEFISLKSGTLKQAPREFNLQDTIHTLIKGLQPEARRHNIELSLFVDPLVPGRVIGDAERLCQALGNLLSSLLAAGVSGHLSLYVSIEVQSHILPIFRFRICHDSLASALEMSADPLARYLQSDTPIDAEQTRRALKLAVARLIIELMGGELIVESLSPAGNSPTGTAVSLTLWLDIAKQQEPPMICFDPGIEGRHNLLIVSESREERDFLTMTLEGWGWHATAVESIEEARQLMMQNQPEGRLALILIDYDCIKSGDAETLPFLNPANRDGHPAIIFIASLPDSPSKALPVHLGEAIVLEKPLHTRRLIEAVSRIVDREKERAASIADTSESNRVETPVQGGHDGTGKRLLLIESDRVTQVLLSRLFTKAGYQVVEHDAGSAAQGAIRPLEFSALLLSSDLPADFRQDFVRRWKTVNKSAEKTPAILYSTLPLEQEPALNPAEGLDAAVSIATGYQDLYDSLGRLTRLPLAVSGEIMTDDIFASDRPPIFDDEKALAMADGDMNLLLGMFDIFDEECHKHLERIESAAAGQDFDGLRQSAQVLERMAGRFGALRLSAIAAKIRDHAEQHDLVLLSPEINRLKTEISELASVVLEYERAHASQRQQAPAL